MKKAPLPLVLIIILFGSCHDVQPAEKVATVISRDNAYCGLCGGWFLNIDSTQYRADIPAPYEKENNKVLIRYELNERPNYRNAGWIAIKSIRQE